MIRQDFQVRSHGGNIREAAERLARSEDSIIDFSANINPAGFPPWLREEISRNVGSLVHYPDIQQKEFRAAAAACTGTEEKTVWGTNGAGEAINSIPQIIQPDHIIIPVPSYGEYMKSSRNFPVTLIKLAEEKNFPLDLGVLNNTIRSLKGKKLVFLGQPNNPTGTLTDSLELYKLTQRHKDTVFCIDESFAAFVEGYVSPLSFAGEIPPDNLVVLRSMTKFYAVPGLRIGYITAAPRFIQELKTRLQPWPVNSLALEAGKRALQDTDFQDFSRTLVTQLRTSLIKSLMFFSWLSVFPGTANFLLIKIVHPSITARDLDRFMVKEGILIRTCVSFEGLDDHFFRLAVRTEAENSRLLEALTVFGQKHNLQKGDQIPVLPQGGQESRTPALMILGTASNAGKSLITAGLCRILSRRGIHTAPFKAQNMALNSAVTQEGLEIGRAQALQAAAAGIKPDVRMNPLLLKPTSDRGSEIILMGKPAGFLNSKNWFSVKERARSVIERSYDSLAAEYDAVILEGAGSPAEINLKAGDIVNTAMARYAGAPAILVGDIDLGGVYASFVGTMELFDEWERDMIQGFLVNKFRGDAALLHDAHNYLLQRTGKPVIGVIPYMPDLDLPEEDSVSFKKQDFLGPREPVEKGLVIGIIDLPSISNFTDYDPFLRDAGVTLIKVRKREEVTASLDAVILPGSKNVISDLLFLKEKGITDAIRNLRETKKTMIIGICGGFQMIGKEILDPHHVESDIPLARGIDLLDCRTSFLPSKHLKEVTTMHLPSGINVKGYEIHHGITTPGNENIIMGSADNLLGASSHDGSVWGTYLHGIFDSDSFRLWFLNTLRRRKGIAEEKSIQHRYNISRELDRFADILEKSIDIDYILGVMRL